MQLLRFLVVASFVYAAPLSPAKTHDLVVYGGTSAGVITAVQAKQMGKSAIIDCPDKHPVGLSSGGLGFTGTDALVQKQNPSLSSAPESAQPQKPAIRERELIRDNHFFGGFTLLDPKPGKRVPYGKIRGLKPNEEPVWELAQWSSRFPLEAGPGTRLDTQAIVHSNEAKRVTLAQPASEHADFSIAVNASTEYAGRHREKGENWVHLLVAQKFESPPALTEIGFARFHLEARLLQSQRIEAQGYTPKLHAAQFLLFFTVQNMNRDSKGFGDFLWFGIPVYDDRHHFPKEHKAQDSGTKKYIFTPGGNAYTTDSAHDGQWITLDKNLLPLMHEGIEAAWATGFLSESRDPGDYRITGMNMGWEVPGIFDVEMQVRNLSLKVSEKK